jgi:N-acetylglutamate synthase-like GNAT family acetyltransferase
MNPSVAIRQAEFRDAAAIFALVKKYPDTVLARPIGDIVQNIDRFLVCEEGQRVIGAVSWQILPEIGSPKSPSVEIKSLCVEPDRVRRGIGRRLVERAIERIRPLRPVQIVVLTFAPEFFAGLGFRETAKEGLMHKIYAGCINCTRYESPFTCPEIAMILPIEQPETLAKPCGTECAQ